MLPDPAPPEGYKPSAHLESPPSPAAERPATDPDEVWPHWQERWRHYADTSTSIARELSKLHGQYDELCELMIDTNGEEFVDGVLEPDIGDLLAEVTDKVWGLVRLCYRQVDNVVERAPARGSPPESPAEEVTDKHGRPIRIGCMVTDATNEYGGRVLGVYDNTVVYRVLFNPNGPAGATASQNPTSVVVSEDPDGTLVDEPDEDDKEEEVTP